MGSELETNLPSIRLLQEYIRVNEEEGKEKTKVEIKLLSDDLLVGKLLWQDPHCICMQDDHNQTTIVWRHAIAYLKPKD